MPPLAPALRRKVDELFLRWLSDPDTQRALHDGLRRIRDSSAPPAADPAPSAAATAAGHAGSRQAPPPAPPPPGDAAAENRRARGDRTVQAPPPAPPPQAPPAPPARGVPAFFFPHGRPPPSAAAAAEALEAALARVERVFARFPRERAAPGDMAAVARACGCPLYWKGPLFHAAGGERSGSVSVHKFVAMWRKVLLTCHDDASKFVQLLGTPGSGGLGQEDFVPFLQDVVNTHPGLAFLKEASEFHSRYITTVIQRIFYTVNRSWSGRITCAELRRSSFLQNVARLEAEPDINRLTEFFSYEHFYVIYCKFWELDADHDLMIDARDLGRHGDHAISSRMIDRIFSGAVTRGRRARKDGKMSYADFVWFLLAEEDKTTPTSIEYWFRCMDLDGDGVLSVFELEHFYAEQARRLEARAVEPLPFRDCVCQALDLVRPRTPGRITLRDLKRCGLAGAFFDTFFNVHKYLDREQPRGEAATPREAEGEAAAAALTDWERFAAEEYDFLVAEEAMAAAAGDGDEEEDEEEEEDAWDDGGDGLGPAPAERPPRSPPPLLFASPPGAVDLFALGDDDDDGDEPR